MRKILILALVSASPLILIGCDSSGSNDEPPSGSNDETTREIGGRYQMISVDEETIPFMQREEIIDVPQTGQLARCEIWLLEDAWIFTFQNLGGVSAKQIETIECITLESPVYTFSGKLKSERTGRYGRVGEDLEIIWNEHPAWTGTIVSDVITFSIPSNEPELDALVASFRKE